MVSSLSVVMAFAKMTGITEVSSLRRASAMVPDWTSHLAPAAKTTSVATAGRGVDTDLVIVVGNKCSGFVTLLLVGGFLTSLAQDGG